MWRAFVSWIAGLSTLSGGADAIDQRAAKLFQLRQFGLLAGYHIIEFMQQLVLVSKS
jgi:hypothetical protein